MIYSMWPLYLYTNATVGKYALLPILEYQAAGLYNQSFAVHDLGAHISLASSRFNTDGHDRRTLPSGNGPCQYVHRITRPLHDSLIGIGSGWFDDAN